MSLLALALAAFPTAAPAHVPATAPETIAVDLADVAEVRITVREFRDDVPLPAHTYRLVVEPREGGGFELSRRGWRRLEEPTESDGAEDELPERTPDGREWVGLRDGAGASDPSVFRAVHVPVLRVGADARFLEFLEVESALNRLAAAQFPDQPRMRQFARDGLGREPQLGAWLRGPRKDWQLVTEPWIGLDLTPGTRRLFGELWFDMPRLERIEREFEVIVDEPAPETDAEDARLLRRVRRATVVPYDVLGGLGAEYLAALGAQASIPRHVVAHEGTHRQAAFVDEATGRIVRVVNAVVLEFSMQTTRKEWTERVKRRWVHELEWIPREG